MKIRYYSHASVQFVSGSGVKLLSDPWLYNPVYGNMMWQFPPCQISLDEYVRQDILYISHTHPDHFCVHTLNHFDRKIPIVIRKYGTGFNLKETLQELGFQKVIELEHRQAVEVAKDFKVVLLKDPTTEDSALLISDNQHTVFNQNDCFLPKEELAWIGENFSIDLACLFFLGSGPYPGSFDLSKEVKEKESQLKKISSFKRAVETAKLLKTKRIIPYSNDMIWPRRPDLAELNGSLPKEFKDYAHALENGPEVFLLASGEEYNFYEKPDDYQNCFNTRQDLLKAYEIFKNYPENIALINSLEVWESTFYFSDSTFFEKFKVYCEYTTKMKLYLNIGEGIQIGCRIKTDSKTFEYLISSDNKENRIEIPEKPLAEIKEKLHMILNSDGHLVAMALAGVITFQDLENSRFLIERPGPFSYAEELFWQFFSGFTWYLETTDQQPLRSGRNKVKAITSNLNVFSLSQTRS